MGFGGWRACANDLLGYPLAIRTESGAANHGATAADTSLPADVRWRDSARAVPCAGDRRGETTKTVASDAFGPDCVLTQSVARFDLRVRR
jgi:hypothetical protein